MMQPLPVGTLSHTPPTHWSAAQADSDPQGVPSGAVVFWHVPPVQVSDAHGGTPGPHDVPSGAASVSQAPARQVSSAHGGVPGPHGVPSGAVPAGHTSPSHASVAASFAGHVLDSPSQVFAVSQTPVAARHGVPAGFSLQLAVQHGPPSHSSSPATSPSPHPGMRTSMLLLL